MEKEKKVEAILIFEMMGRPENYLIETMNKFLETLSSEKGIEITNKTVHDAKKVEQKDKEGKPIPGEPLFSTFAEVEVKCLNLRELLGVSFKYMPAHVEIIYPESFEFKNLDFNSLVNDLLTRLHHYDSVAKTALINNQALGNRLNQLLSKQEANSKITDTKKKKKQTKKKK